MTGEILTVDDRTAWRQWLAANYRTASEVWLVYHRKRPGIARIAYNDAVEEALCFYWIDSTVRTIDDDRYVQRFTPDENAAPTHKPTENACDGSWNTAGSCPRSLSR